MQPPPASVRNLLLSTHLSCLTKVNSLFFSSGPGTSPLLQRGTSRSSPVNRAGKTSACTCDAQSLSERAPSRSVLLCKISRLSSFFINNESDKLAKVDVGRIHGTTESATPFARSAMSQWVQRAGDRVGRLLAAPVTRWRHERMESPTQLSANSRHLDLGKSVAHFL